MVAKYTRDREQITTQSIQSLVRDLRESWRAGDEALGKPTSDPEDGSESSQNENSSLTENDECHDLSDFPPAQAAGCQLDPECLENYDLWEFVVSKVAVEAMNGRMMVAHMKPVGCDQLLCNRLPVTVCHNFGRRQPAFCRLCERCCAISS